MNHMNFIVWMLPILFMFHDFEEILMAEVWGRRYHDRIHRIWPNNVPLGGKFAGRYQTPTFSLAVYVEFLLFSVVSWLSVYFNSYFVWYIVLMGYTFHLFVHMFLCISFKGYVPGVITAVISILPSIYYLFKATKLLCINVWTFFLALIFGIIFLALLLSVLHKMFEPWSKWFCTYSKTID